MDKSNNKFNKDRNKFNMNQIPNQNFPHGKRIKRNFQMMPYDQSQNPNLIQNEEFNPTAPYLNQNMYQMQMPIQNNDNFMKNAFKTYFLNNKKPYAQYPVQDFINGPENEMSLEDNGLIGNKKYNEKKRFKKAKNQYYMPNNEMMQFNPYNYGISNPDMINNQNGEFNAENNNNEIEQIPGYYYNNEFNNKFHKKFGPKMGKKKQIMGERNNNKNRNKKIFKKRDKKFYEENNDNEDNIPNYNYINNNKQIYINNQNKKREPYSKKSYKNEAQNESSFGSDFNSSEEEEKEEDYEIENREGENNDDNNNKDKSDDIVVIDNSSKEEIDIKKIKLVEKKKIPEKSNNKIKIIPELDKMCSEKEIMEREKSKDIDRLEIDADAFPQKKALKERMVQKYEWRWNKKLDLSDPKEIRTIKALKESIEYLIDQCLDNDITKVIKIPTNFDLTPKDIIPFIYDRFVAIYKTIELLSNNDLNILNDRDLIADICKMVRTVIIFLNLCLDYFNVENAAEEINNYINNLLIPLLDMIKDIIDNETDYEYNLSLENKDEFLSYYLFIKLKKNRNNFQRLYDEIKSKLNSDKNYNKIDLVYEIYLTLKNKDYQKFIDILKDESECDYFQACLMSLFFKEICVYGLQKISLTKKELTYREIKNLLTFEDIDEIKYFLIWYGITKDKSRYSVNETDIVPIFLNNLNKKYDYDKAKQNTNKRYVEKKKGDSLKKDMVNKNINIIKNENYINNENNEENINNNDANEIKENKININKSLFSQSISQEKNNTKLNNLNTSPIGQKETPINKIINNNINMNAKVNIPPKLNESFISNSTIEKIFPDTIKKNNNLTPKTSGKKNENISINKSVTDKKLSDSDIFLKPYSPKITSFESPKSFDSGNNKSMDIFPNISISSIEPQKNPPNFTQQTLEFFCEVSNSAINKLISNHKLDFIYRLKFISEKYKIKLDLIEDYINRRKFFVFNELKKCCLDKKYSREYFKELLNYKNNINSQNTNEDTAFKIENKNIAINKKFELLTYDDIIYFIISNYKNSNININNNQKGYINHLQINIYTTKDLIKSTKLFSGLKLGKNLIKENDDGTELTISNPEINIDSENNKISFIMKFIFVDQIIDLDSYIYENQNNIQKYSILIPFFDIIKSDPENQQILTKFFTILDLGLGDFIKKEIIFFFIKRDIEPSSDLYQEYQNIQNDFIFNLTQKYSTNTNKNNIINVDENYENNEEIKKRIIYLSPIDEFGKIYQEYIKYLNNKTFVELFENNKIMHLYTFNPKEILIPFAKHITSLDIIINHYIDIIEEDLKNNLDRNHNINYFFSKKLCIEVLIGFVMCKILLIYYQNKCLVFANELYKIPIEISNYDLLLLESNLLNTGSILRQINLEGYDIVWKKCMNLDINKNKDIFSYFDIFSEMICSYHLISDIDIQNFEFIFRKQYYDINLEKNNYEIAKKFVDFFNKIISKFFENNNLNIRLDNTAQIIEKIYDKNKQYLINTISKIITNNDNLIFNENLIYVKGLENFYLALKDKEIADLHNNLNKKRKRKAILFNDINNNSNINSNTNKKNMGKINRMTKIKENKNIIINNNINVININESIDKSKDISNSFILKDIGDISGDYYKYFQTVKKFTLPDGLI